MEMFFTDYWRLTSGFRAVDPFTTRMVIALESVGIQDGMPFILSSDGSYDARLNQFFRELPTRGVRTRDSWRSFGRDVFTWARYLEECRHRSVWEADLSDLVSFHAVRRGVLPASTGTLTPQTQASSWNRCVAALDKFYKWALDHGYIRVIPFTYRQAQIVLGESRRTIEVNEARERGEKDGDVRFISIPDYLLFRDVGLRGRLPSGHNDPTFRGRNGERNAVFAELLVTTGLRLTEANSLLTIEIPSMSSLSNKRNCKFDIAPAITKGRKNRTIRLPKRVVKLVHTYEQIERSLAIERAQRGGSYQHLSRWMHVTAIGQRNCTVVRGNQVLSARIDMLAPVERGQLYRTTDAGTLAEPLALWLNEGGTPMKPDTWEAIFKQASLRCQRFGIDVKVTPHTLRHTFAVHMLATLIREQIGALFASPPREDGVLSDPTTASKAAYQRLAGDPLWTLKKMLGHSSVTTTAIYLTNIMEAKQLVDDAVDRYAAELAPLLGEGDDEKD